MATLPKTPGKKVMPEGKRFGSPGHPGGRKAGARNLSTRLYEAMATGKDKTIIKKLLDQAAAGEPTAQKLVVDRIWPVRKGAPIHGLDLGQIGQSGDVIRALSQVVIALSQGLVSPEEAKDVATLIEASRRAIDTEDLARRIEALEDARNDKPS